MTDERAVFEAAFPAIQSAIKIYGDRQGMRVQLDVPESEMGEATKLLLWRERVLKVTVEPSCTDLNDETQEGAERGAPILDRRRSAIRRD